MKYTDDEKKNLDQYLEMEKKARSRQADEDFISSLSKASAGFGAIGGVKPESSYVASNSYGQEADRASKLQQFLMGEASKRGLKEQDIAAKKEETEAETKRQLGLVDYKMGLEKGVYGDKFKNEQSLLAQKLAGEERLAKLKAENEKNIASMKSQDGKAVSPSDIRQFGEGRTAVGVLDQLEVDLSANKDLVGPFAGRLGGLNPYDTRAQTLRSQAKAAAQQIGKYMEGGVLRAEDIPKYEAMLPQMSDTPEVAQAKLSQVRNLLQRKIDTENTALAEQGYKTGGLSAPDSTGFKPSISPAPGSATASPMETEKVVGGVRYKKVPGGWQKAE